MKAWAAPAVVIFAIATFISGVILMPAAELMPAQLQHGPITPGLSPIRSYEAMQWFNGVANSIVGALGDFKPGIGPNVEETMSRPMHDNIPGEVRAYAIYAVFLAGAMILAAIAINAVGRWDSEEKTTIPIKK
jgi:hypothetical protein